MQRVKHFITKYWPYLVIIILTTLIELPQLQSGHVIIGADTLFHYNRFYDTAMQIRHHNLQYWIMMYGFNHSGRIVNAVYSPFLAYIIGGLLLLCHSFFTFQILSDYIVPILAGMCLQIGFRIAGLKSPRNKILIAFYPFTYQVFHWNVSCNFTSIGAIVLPLVIGCLVATLRTRVNQVIPLELGMLMGLIAQVHLVSAYQAIFLCMLILPAGLAVSRQKGTYIAEIVEAAAIAIALSFNILGGLLELFTNNHVTPLYTLNYNNDRSFIYTEGSDGQFVNGFTFVMILIILLIAIRASRRSAKYIGALAIFFYFLASPILPWKQMMDATPIFGWIQYPGRLLTPAVILSCFFMAMIFKDDILVDWLRHLVMGIIGICIVVSGISNFRDTAHMSQAITIQRSIRPRVMKNNHAYHDLPKISKAFQSDDMGYALQTAYQSTPDYMPLTHKYTWQQVRSMQWGQSPQSKAYWDNLSYIYMNPQEHKGLDKVTSRVVKYPVTTRINFLFIHLKYHHYHHKLIFTMNNLMARQQKLIVPVAAYQGTQATINGEAIDVAQNQCDRNLNFPETYYNPGKTRVKVSYNANPADNLMILISLLSWILALILVIYSSLAMEKYNYEQNHDGFGPILWVLNVLHLYKPKE